MRKTTCLLRRLHRLSLAVQLTLSILFQKLAAKGGTLENGLDQVVWLERLRKVFVHLRLNALFAVTHHSMRRQGDDGSAVVSALLFVLSDLLRRFKSALFEG